MVEEEIVDAEIVPDEIVPDEPQTLVEFAEELEDQGLTPFGMPIMPVTKAAERKQQDAMAANQVTMKRLSGLGVAPSPVGILAARVRALLSISPDDGVSYEASKKVKDPIQILVNAIEGLVMIGIGGDPGRKQAFDLAFEVEVASTLKDIETQVNQSKLAGGGPRSSPGGIILP